MARVDSSFGVFNYTQTFTGTAETPLLSPPSSGINSGLPSPLFPATTAQYPVGLFIAVPPDIAGGSFDNNPFEVQLNAKISGTLTTNVLINLYNAKGASWSGSPYVSSYTLASLGAGCTNVVTGPATAGITATASVAFWMKAQFFWNSTTKILGFGAAAQYVNGAVAPIISTANATNIGPSDLNFIPSFTFSGGGKNTVDIVEFVINRL